MKILLLGANGQLGHAILRSAAFANTGTITAATRDGKLFDGGSGEPADLSVPESLPPLLDRLAPDVIINAAAYTAVDRAEQEEALATRINGDVPGVLGSWAAGHGALVMHYSTDYVFSGEGSKPYSVDATPAPLGAYGRSKLAGELALRQSGARHLIFRTAWVYGPHGNNFLKTMLRLAQERDELRVVADQTGTPTSTGTLVDASLAALQRWQAVTPKDRTSLEGTHHLTAAGSTTWHGFAEAIFDHAQVLGLIARRPLVHAISTEQYPTPAKRPRYSVLDTCEFERTFQHPLPLWQAGMDEVLTALSYERT